MSVPPQDLVAEQAILGSAMLSGDALDTAGEIVNPGDFYRPAHETIYRAALALAVRREPVDSITVIDELTKTGDLDRCGGAVYIHECVTAVPTTANVGHYARIVAEKSSLRRIDELARRMLDAVHNGGGTAEDIIQRGEDEIAQVAASRSRVHLKPLSDTLMETIDWLDDPVSPFTPTPWLDLDTHIHGWRPGAVHVIAATPGSGKSLMGLQAAIGMARTRKAVAYAVMEMDTNELNVRLLAQCANIGMTELTNRRLSGFEWDKLSRSVPELSEMPLYVDDLPRQTVAHVRAHARQVARRADLGMIVVDYLQQITPPEHLLARPRTEQVAHTTQHLKALAREMNVPVIALAQLNRAGAQRIDKTPRLSDLRESGAIEADADVVALLWREDSTPHDLNVVVRKARQGKEGTFRLHWDAGFARVTNHSDPYGTRT